ncbi:MAG: NADH-quinone oxidoreductase subunit N [Candidatus Dormibacteria bacterium]
MLLQTAPLVPLVTPSGNDLLDLLPELILGGGFIALMLLDLVAGKQRWVLGATAILFLAGAFGASVWGWFDSGAGHSLYFGSFAYDKFAMFINMVLLFSTALVILISPQYLNRRGIHHGEYYALIIAATLGMMLLAGAMSLMVIFLGIESLSIALYILSGFARHEERSQEAALKYLLLGGFASGFLLYGMALVYGETGHTQLTLIAQAIAAGGKLSSSVDPLLLAGVILIFVGFAFKASLVPFHAWTPDVYQGAPTSVTTFMSVTTKVAAFAVIVRVFTYTFPALYTHWQVVVAVVAIASMVVGNVAALTQTSLKRMLAYSSIAQAGYILIGVAVGPLTSGSSGNLGTIGVLYYLAAYAVTQIGAFAVITVMAGRGEDLDSYDGLRGLAYRRPYVAAAMGLFLLSLGGFPPTAGFFGKFFVFAAAIQANLTVLALWGIATSAVSVFYYLRVALLMYQRPRADQTEYPWSRTTLAGTTVLVATTAGTLVFGILVVVLFNGASAAQGALLPALTAAR